MKKIKIINVSIGVYKNSSEDVINLCKVFFGDRGIDACNTDVAIEELCKQVQLVNKAGSLIVAAAGNLGENILTYPAACDGAVAVAATDASDSRRMDGSNFGKWVDVAAPGEDILSTIPRFTTSPIGHATSFFSEYTTLSGTSQAAPHVSGALAQILARHPEWKDDSKGMTKAIKRMEKSAVPLSKEQLGAGRIDVFEAVFNGNFELVDENDIPVEWEMPGTRKYDNGCQSATQWRGVLPIQDEGDHKPNQRMLVCEDTEQAQIIRAFAYFDIPEGVDELPISFDWQICSFTGVV